MIQAFYSLIQFCPDRFRAESLNVGLVVLCPGTGTFGVRTLSRFNRIASVFALDYVRRENLKANVRSMVKRIEAEASGWNTQADLADFAASRANDLRMTSPRLVKVEQLDADFEGLFCEFVEEPQAVTVK